ncbi:MAG: efflux RND transporter periplasmic adaptor subunit [Verrucomicrobia bacterium]|nr:efflux RND transporter periplasmic adaptor subunit [Verrucomicrobiota bacterium]
MKKPIVVLGVIVAAGLGWFGYEWLARPVAEVFAVQRGTATSAVYGTVKVQPTVKMLVRSRNVGAVRLSRMSTGAEIVAGMEIREGWTLARIESPELDRELIKVEADLKAAEQRCQLGPPSQQLLKTAEAMLARLEKLAELRNAPASEVEKARNEVQALRERVKTEQVEIERLMTTAREAAGALRDRKARCDVKAPMDGVLAAITVVSGDLVVEGAPLFVCCTKTCFLEGFVNEEDVGGLKKEMKAVVRLYSYPNKDFTATLTDIIPAGENQRYMIRLSFDAPPDNLMAGMTGETNIILGKREGALLIPSRALMVDRVFVVEGGTITLRVVKAGLRSLERTEIFSGLKEGEPVVVSDHDAFRVGQWVRTIAVNR